jgi:hypothetical protein
VRYDGNALAGAAVRSGVDPVAARHADGSEPDTRFQAAGAVESARQGGRIPRSTRSRGRRRDDGRRHRRVVRAARIDGHAAGSERRAPGARDGARGKALRDRLRDPRRVRDAADRLIPDVAGEGVARADVVIEAIFENVDAKRSLFAAIERAAKPSAILATNTSSIPLEDIATAMSDPSRFIGLHFFNPVPKMMLVEVVHGNAHRRVALAPAAAFVRQIDKLPLPVKARPASW